MLIIIYPVRLCIISTSIFMKLWSSQGPPRSSYLTDWATVFKKKHASFFCIHPRKMPSSLLDMNKSLVLSTDRLIACWLGHSRCVSLCSQDEKLFQSMTVMTKHDQDHYIRNNILNTLDRPQVFLDTSSVVWCFSSAWLAASCAGSGWALTDAADSDTQARAMKVSLFVSPKQPF